MTINNKNWRITHGLSRTRIYKIYWGIKERCNNANSTRYNSYGGRGIRCEWKTFEEFYEDMKDGYSDNLTIDRINNDGSYNKENCRWITNLEQQSNKSNNNIITIGDKTQTLTQWCNELGLKLGTVGSRLTRGWTIERALELK